MAEKAKGGCSVKSMDHPSRAILQRSGPAYLKRFGLGMLLVAGLVGYHLHLQYHGVLAQWAARESSVANDRSRMISEWLKERQNDAEALAGRSQVINALALRGGNENSPPRHSSISAAALGQTLDRFARIYGFEAIYVVDPQGAVVGKTIHADQFDAKTRQSARETAKQAQASIVLLGSAPDNFQLSFSAPVIPEDIGNRAGPATPRALGAVVIRVQLAQSLFPLLLPESVPTRSGETLLVYRDGNDVVLLAPLRHRSIGRTGLRLPYPSPHLAAQAALQGEETFGGFMDYRGARVLAATRRIPATGWGLVTKVDRAEALQEFYRNAWSEVLAALLLLTAFAGVLFAQRRHAESAAINNEREKFRELLDSAPDAMVIVGPAGQILLVNTALEEMFGHARSELLGQSFLKLVPERFRAERSRFYAQLFESPAPTPEERQQQRWGLRKNGEEFPADLTISVIATLEGRVVAISIRDTTERQRSERERDRLNRALKTLSECNQALVRARDEAELLGHLCQVIVREGGYSLAWVVYAAPEEAKTLRLMAHAGESVPATESPSWAAGLEEQDGASRAIRSGQVYVTRSQAAPGRAEPPQEGRLRCGYAASISLPLISGGQTFGALSVCSMLPESFEAEEVKLLTELAQDCSYGIQGLRARTEREQASKELRASESKYRTLVENIPQKIFMKTKDFRWISINKKFAQDLGIAPRDAIGKVDYDFYPQELADKYRADDRRIMETGVTEEFDESYVVGGERRVVHTVKTPIRDEAGEISGILGVFWDITDRMRAEEALRHASAYNRSLIEASLDPLVTISAGGTIMDVNTATERVTGRTRQELIGTDFSDYFTEPEKARSGYRQAFREGWVQDYALEIRRRDGHLTPVLYNASVYKGETGEVIGVFAAARDITARKQAQQALEAERQRFNDILEALPAYLVLLTPDYRVPFANRYFRERFGESQGRRCYEYLFGRSEPCEICVTYAVLKTGAPQRWEWLGPDGRNYDIYDFPFADADNSPLILEMGIDVTERKKAEEQIRQLNENLEQRVRARTAELESANKELEAFTYSVSHDLRSPLRHIDGFSQLLMEEYGPQVPEEAQGYLRRIQGGVRQMSRLVDDLLNLARIGRQEIKLQVTGLASLVEEVINDLKSETSGRAIDWKVEALPFVEGDPALLKQVFVNLLSNAAKFTRPRKRALIEVGAATVHGQAAVFVRDNGVGFNMKYADKLFGVFQRLHRTEDFEGTGVGLATVQRIINKHGGRIWAEAELDRGATFYFTLGIPGREGLTAAGKRGEAEHVAIQTS